MTNNYQSNDPSYPDLVEGSVLRCRSRLELGRSDCAAKLTYMEQKQRYGRSLVISIGVGISVGSGMGTALGVAMHNIGLGIGIGFGIGIVLGAAIGTMLARTKRS